MNTTNRIGVILLMLASGLGVWVFDRVTSVVGRLHSWSPPLNEYEVTTICMGLAAAVCLLVGLRYSKDKKEGA